MKDSCMEGTKVCDRKEAILKGKTALGIEFGSTRIKAVLINDHHEVLATGSYEWENQLRDGIWTYALDDVWKGLQESYRNLKEEVKKNYQIELKNIGVIGLSGMQHGYMPFDKNDNLLVPMRTWRNTITGQASKELTELFEYPIPQRWSIAHLYQAIINGEEHLSQITYLITIAGYVHWRLTGEKVIGINEASGMFPIDLKTKNYDQKMIQQFQNLICDKKFPWSLENILPKVLLAGENAGVLTEEGALLLDPSGQLCAGIPFCPPEGDGGTGLVATNSVAVRTGNISAGTSVFAAIVLEKELKKVHEELDLEITPDGNLVGIVHCNNCTSDLNAWVNLFDEVLDSFGNSISKSQLYEVLYNKALEGENNCGGLLAYNYLSGEHITGFEKGCPLFVRSPESHFNLANFMRTHLYAALAVIKIGMDILLKEEGVKIDSIIGHGGLFKTEKVGQKIVADALNVPVTLMETASEGGAWGIAILAAYKKNKSVNESFVSYLSGKVFVNQKGIKMEPNSEGVKGFEEFIGHYKKGLAIENSAVEHF